MNRNLSSSSRGVMDSNESQALLAHLEIPNQVELAIREGPKANLDRFLIAVDKLQNASIVFEVNRHLSACEGALRRSNVLLSTAMQFLLEEFVRILDNNSSFIDPVQLREQLSLGDSNTFHEQLVIPDCVPHLHEMARRMVVNGMGAECANSYRDKRILAVQQSLERLGMEKLNRQAIHTMPWNLLSSKMKEWVEQIRICIKVLLAGEKSLCEIVFHDLEPFQETCFAEMANASLAVLFNFAHAIVDSSKSPEKLPYLLDMYEAIEELQLYIGIMFAGPAGHNLRTVMPNLLRSFASAVRDTYNEFESTIAQQGIEQPAATATAENKSNFFSSFLRVFGNEQENDAHNRVSVPHNADILKLTGYVVNYLKFLLDSDLNYLGLLRTIFKDSPQADGSYKGGALATATSHIMQALKTNIEQKALQGYNDAGFRAIFLMNNFSKIYNTFSNCNVREILGEPWIRRYKGYVESKRDEYLLHVTTKIHSVLSVVETDPLKLASRFKNFNQIYEEIRDAQNTMAIPDVDLKRHVRDSVRARIMENFYNFIDVHRKMMMENRNVQKCYVHKYEDIDRELAQSFP